MAKLHEHLAAGRTRTAAWAALFKDTEDKFKKFSHFFEGHTRTLKMLEDHPTNDAVEAAERQVKPVITTVYETLQDALTVFAKAEDLEYQKNMAKHSAVGTIYWKGKPWLEGAPIDELLGLENRIGKLRELWLLVPTQDATRTWTPIPHVGAGQYEAEAEETTKTEKKIIPIVLMKATVEHPAQVTPVNKDEVVGRFRMVRRTGAATAQQKFEALKQIDDLLIEIKSARQRANETPVLNERLGERLAELLLEPFKTNA